MRLALISIVLLLSGVAQAVITKKCPETLNLNVPEVQKFSKSFIEKIIQEKEFNFDYGESYDKDSIEFFLNKKEIEKGFAFEFKLESKRNSSCYYEQKEYWDGILEPVISGTDKKPLLTISYFNDEEAYEDEQAYREVLMFADVISKTPSYNFSGAELQLKVTGTQSSWGDFFTVYIPVGQAKISDDASLKYQVTPESWSIDLILETCKVSLEKAIADAIQDLGGDPIDSIFVLPKTIGYRYFNVIFKAKDGNFALPQDSIEYQFEYRTQDDSHLLCTEVLPHDLVY